MALDFNRKWYWPYVQKRDLAFTRPKLSTSNGGTVVEPKTSRRPPGRPRRPALSEELIGETALALIDAHGWDRLTMTALAEALGVRAPSLYHHITGQNEIVHLVRRQVVRKIADPSIAELPWESAAMRFGAAYYRAFEQHPQTIQVLSMTPIEDEETFAMYETFLRVLKRAGFRATPAIDLLTGIENLALGFAFEHNASDQMFAADKADSFGAPTFAEFIREQTADGYVPADAFETVLRRFVRMFLEEGDLAMAQVSSGQDPA